MNFRETPLSTGTGFIWRAKGEVFLITNWHNVTGINPRTGEHPSPYAGEPDRVLVLFDLAGSPLGTRGLFSFPLHDENGVPLWLEHPEMARNVDVAALPLPLNRDAELYPINEMQKSPMLEFPMLVSVGVDAFILGYPFNIKVSTLPIWKRASIASEPGVAVDGKPCFYVDTASRPGMSGSPVILRSWGGSQIDDGGLMIAPGPVTRLIGVYSGRIGAEDELQAQLGIVWRIEAVDEIITAGRRGSVTP
ncbi:MAG TPA: trypsin-like peptidase domain-containing protein [Methylocella sp.]|nr:trypsin-like peptidase domain-containing protein [Methylocella sp.]